LYVFFLKEELNWKSNIDMKIASKIDGGIEICL